MYMDVHNFYFSFHSFVSVRQPNLRKKTRKLLRAPTTMTEEVPDLPVPSPLLGPPDPNKPSYNIENKEARATCNPFVCGREWSEFV